VQRKASNLTAIGHGRFPERASVFDVATDRMPKLRQVDANLIGATGFEAALQFAEASDSPQLLKVGDGSFARRLVIVWSGGAAS
jgi:hypothetical protein